VVVVPMVYETDGYVRVDVGKWYEIYHTQPEKVKEIKTTDVGVPGWTKRVAARIEPYGWVTYGWMFVKPHQVEVKDKTLIVHDAKAWKILMAHEDELKQAGFTLEKDIHPRKELVKMFGMIPERTPVFEEKGIIPLLVLILFPLILVFGGILFLMLVPWEKIFLVVLGLIVVLFLFIVIFQAIEGGGGMRRAVPIISGYIPAMAIMSIVGLIIVGCVAYVVNAPSPIMEENCIAWYPENKMILGVYNMTWENRYYYFVSKLVFKNDIEDNVRLLLMVNESFGCHLQVYLGENAELLLTEYYVPENHEPKWWISIPLGRLPKGDVILTLVAKDGGFEFYSPSSLYAYTLGPRLVRE
jgi:hypothetical protein